MILTEDCLKVKQSIHFSKYSKVFPWVKLGHEKAIHLNHISLAPWRIAFNELYFNIMPSAFIEGDYKKHQYEIHYCLYWQKIWHHLLQHPAFTSIKFTWHFDLKDQCQHNKSFSLIFILLLKKNYFPPPHVLYYHQVAFHSKLNYYSCGLQLMC